MANERYPVKSFPTPLLRDVLFYVLRDAVLPKNKTPEYGMPYNNLDARVEDWPDHRLVFIGPVDEDGKQKWYFAAERESQDEYNWEYVDADIAGAKFPAVKRSYVGTRKDFDPDTPAMGSSMPDVPFGKFGTGAGDPSVLSDYVMSERNQVRIGDKELDALFIAEQRTYIQRCIINEIGVDPLNGKTLYSYTYLYYGTEVVSDGLTANELLASPSNAYWGLQSNGFQVSGQRLSAEWVLIEHQQVVGGTIVEGGVAIDSVTSNENYYWPPVLDTYELLDWGRLDGSFDYFPAIRFSPEGYEGPCLVTTTRSWKVTPHTIAVVGQMIPTRIYYASPFFTVNIPECLHPKLGFQCDIGNTDTTYAENTGSTRYFSATNYTEWPKTITATDKQEPFRGGYLRTTRVVARPTPPTQVDWVTGS